MKNEIQNVVIIGGGMAGLSAGLYNARANLSPLVIAGSPPGGQLMLTSEVENFPGQEQIMGSQLVETLRKQVGNFGGIIKNENVLDVDFSGEVLKIKTSSGEIQTKAVIIATGARALWMGLESETRLRGKGISACATCDGFFFKNKIVAVIGGGDSALEEAIFLTKFASKVFLIHRRDSFRASKIMQKKALENPKVEVIYNAQVEDVLGQNVVEGIRLNITNPEGKLETKDILLQGIFVAIGHKPDTDIFAGKVQMDAKGYILTSGTIAVQYAKESKVEGLKSKVDINEFDFNWQTMTSVQGVFGAGDCVDHIYKQASTASGMGVASALDAERWLESKT
ncbi:MAG: FAD-dependent oxidoreductase [Candidatus Roizmanbacteria bacterium]